MVSRFRKIREKFDAFFYTETTSRIAFFQRRQAMNLRSACIAQLIQVELLRLRRCLTKIPVASLSYSRFLK
jgi:hypothetical protein